LIGGIAAWFRGRIRIVAVEPVDAETDGIAADSLAPKRVGQIMFPIA
jgi:threonine dehydratase